MLVVAQRHAELARRLTPRSQLEQVLLARGVTDPELLERAAAADRLTRQVMADVDGSRPGSPATARAPGQTTTRGLGAAQARAEAEPRTGVTQVKAGVMPNLRPGPEPADADTAQLEDETGAHTQSPRPAAAAPELPEAGRTAHATQAVVSEPVRHAEARAGAEPLTWQPAAADASPEYWAQAEAEMDGPEIEL